ncbi:MAG: CsgG/HfaB family protein [Spirochaetota bacterium]
MRKLLMLLCIALILGACVNAPPYKKTAPGQRPQDVKGIHSVKIEASNSNIAIKGEQRREVVLFETPSAYDREGDTLYLEVDNADKFRISVPHTTRIYVENSNGTLLLSEVFGDTEAELENTEVFVINPGRLLDIETSNSPINIVKRRGRIINYSAVTTNADIHTIIPAENLNIDLETSNGYFNINNLPVTLLERNAEEFVGYIGSENSGILELETTNSTITLEPVGVRSGANLLATGIASGYQELLKRRINQFLGTVNENFADTLREILKESAPAAHALSDDKESEHSPPPRTADVVPRRTVVFPFEETNPPAEELGLGAALSEMLITAVANSPSITVIERSQIKSILEESKYQMSGYTSTEESIEIGNLLNSEIIIVGSVSRFGERVELDARVIRLETGEVLFTQYGSSPDDKLREMVNTLGNEISSSIADISY